MPSEHRREVEEVKEVKDAEEAKDAQEAEERARTCGGATWDPSEHSAR